MSPNSRLVDILIEICDLLATYGHQDHARRLQGELQRLLQEDTPPEILEETRKRLHKAVTGMGGLIDLWPVAPTHEESVRAQARLAELSDELYELTG